MNISYFINQYPKVSHSFIRREILALERQGFRVQRIALRGWDADLVDETDIEERELTNYILLPSKLSLVLNCVTFLLKSPLLFFKAFKLMLDINKGSNRSFFLHLVSLIEAIAVKDLTDLHNSEHIHAHFGTNSAEVVMYTKILGGPSYSFTVHGPEEFDKPLQIHLREKVKHAKFVVAITSFCRSQLYRWCRHEDWRKISIVHCGIEKSFYDGNHIELTKKNNFVCVGRLCEQKGQLLIIEACRELKSLGHTFHFTFAGDGEMRAECEQLITKYELEDYIEITGWISSNQVRDHILQSDALVLPSFAEGLPVVIMEAMFLKRPVISTYIAGIPELISHEKNGYLITAGSSTEIVKAIEDMMSGSEKELLTMSENAFIEVLKSHDIDVEASKLGSLIKDTDL